MGLVNGNLQPVLGAPLPLLWAPGGVVTGITGLAALGYGWLVYTRLGSSKPVPSRQLLAFGVGWLIWFVDLQGFPAVLGYYLESVHAAQQLLLICLVAPLLVTGLRGLLPNLPLITRGWHWASKPLYSIVILAGVVYAWHLPPLYNLAFVQPHWASVQPLTYVLAAMLVWQWVLGPVFTGGQFYLPRGQKRLELAAALGMALVMLGVALPVMPLFVHYRQLPIRLWSLAPQLDKYLAGVATVTTGFVMPLSMLFLIDIHSPQDGADDQPDLRRYLHKPRTRHKVISLEERLTRSEDPD